MSALNRKRTHSRASQSSPKSSPIGFVANSITSNYVDPYEEAHYNADVLQLTEENIIEFEENVAALFNHDPDGHFAPITLTDELERLNIGKPQTPDDTRMAESAAAGRRGGKEEAGLPPTALELPQLKRLPEELVDVIRNDRSFRAVLTSLRMDTWVKEEDLELFLMRSGISIKQRNDEFLVCAAVLPIDKSDPFYKLVDDTPVEGDTEEDARFILSEYAKSRHHSEAEDEDYASVMDDHVRFVLKYEAHPERNNVLRIVEWTVEVI